jgi:hypothetical protein
MRNDACWPGKVSAACIGFSTEIDVAAEVPCNDLETTDCFSNPNGIRPGGEGLASGVRLP